MSNSWAEANLLRVTLTKAGGLVISSTPKALTYPGGLLVPGWRLTKYGQVK